MPVEIMDKLFTSAMDLRHFSSLPEDEPEDEPILLQERVLEAEAEVAPLEEVARAEKKASAAKNM